jgi:O-antigen/teichoic acid export membrane protein
MNSTALIARFRRLVTGGTPLRRQLTGAAAGSLLLSLCSKGLMLLASILLARGLGAASYGIYASAIATVVLLGVPTTLGLPTLVIRLLASYRVHQEWGLMRGLLQRANLVVLLLSMILAGMGAAVVWALGDRLAVAQAHALWWAMALLPITALGALRSAALRGLHHVLLGQLPENLITPSLFVALLVAWGLLGRVPALTPEVAVALRLAAAVVAFSVGAWLLLRRLPVPVHNAMPRYDIGSWSRSAGPLLFLGGMSILNTQTDVLMLAAIKGPEPAGIYSAAASGAGLVTFLLAVVNITIQPTVSRLYATGDMQRLQKVVTIAARGALVLALPVALILILFGQRLLGFAFGAQFEVGALCLSILCAAQVVNAGAGSVGPILNMTGHERDSAVGMAVGAITNVVLNLTFIPLWGIEGAALATGLSLLAWNVMLAVRVWQKLGLDSTALGIIRSRN